MRNLQWSLRHSVLYGNPKQAFVDYASSHTDDIGNKQFTTNHGPKNFSEAVNAWKDKPNFNWERTQSFTSLQKGLKEELRSKGIKSPSKLLSPKNLSQASLEEQNRNPSSLKRVYFINFVVILRKEDEVREEENVNPNATKYNDNEMTAKAKEKVEEKAKISSRKRSKKKKRRRRRM
ncbi:hypothetical protein Tco_0818508 [Tanacetum coccineum]